MISIFTSFSVAQALSPSSPTSALSGGHPDPWVSAGSKADEKLLKLPVDAVIVTSAKGVEDKKRTASLVARLRYERKQLERFRSGKRKVRKKAGAMDQDSLSSSSPYASSEESLSHGVRRRHALEEGARTHNLRETKRSRTHSFKANHAEELQLVMKVKVLEGGGFQCEHIFPKSTNEIDKAQHPPGAKTEMEFSSIARHSHTDSSSGIAESMAAAALGARQRSQSQQKTLASNGRTAKTASKVFVPFVYSDSSDSDEDVPVRRRRSRLPASLTVSPPSKSHEARSLSLQSGSFEDSQEAIANKEAVEFIERMRDVHMICPEKYAQFVTLVRVRYMGKSVSILTVRFTGMQEPEHAS